MPLQWPPGVSHWPKSVLFLSFSSLLSQLLCLHQLLCSPPSAPQIFLWSLRASELTGMAFIDTQLYIHQMISVKNFILAADVMKSISLLRYQEESKTLSLVSRVLTGTGV